MQEFVSNIFNSNPQNTTIFSQFSNSLLGQQLNEQKMLYSPINIQMALLMTYMGANNKTKQEMKHALGLKNIQDELIHSEMGQVQTLLNKKSNTLLIKTANKVFCDHTIELIPKFQNQLKTYYNSQIDKIDFNNGLQAIQTINQWVEKQTENKIQNLLEKVEEDEKLVLVSAIYFKGLWKNQFKSILTNKESPFNSHIPNTNQKVDLMYQENKFKYHKAKDYEILEMKYQDERFSMVFILPKQSLDFQQFQTQFHKQSLMDSVLSQINSKVERKVEVFIPKFKLTSNLSLKQTLQNLGMIEAFDLVKADFSNLEKKNSLCISDVIHKAFIEVNEEGSEAAAATAVRMKLKNCVMPKKEEIPVFRADRSFLYCIKENTKQNLLFVGNFQGQL